MIIASVVAPLGNTRLPPALASGLALSLSIDAEIAERAAAALFPR